MRAVFRKIHLWLSLPLGLLISVICLTGAILVFEQDITRALQRGLYTVTPPSEEAQPLSPSRLAALLDSQVADTLHLTSLRLSGDPHEAAFASFRETGRKQLGINPYTGEVKGWTRTFPFFQTVKKIHRWMMDPPPSKGQGSAGKTIVGVTTLAMVVILVSGLFIWIPRTRKALKNRLKISVSKGWRRFWYDSHAATGFYCTVFLLVMALTGLTWSFGWYRTAAYSLFGAVMETSGRSDAPVEGRRSEEAVLQKVNRPYVVTFDPETGSVVGAVPYSERQRPQTLKGWFYAFHTGSWGGMVTKVLYFLAALIGGILPLSGYWLWWKRIHGNR